jgi:hypothetical protein
MRAPICLYCFWTFSTLRGKVAAQPHVGAANISRVWGVQRNQARAGLRVATTIIVATTNVVFQIVLLLMTLEIRLWWASCWARFPRHDCPLPFNLTRWRYVL